MEVLPEQTDVDTEWALDPAFKEIPVGLMRGPGWRDMGWNKWRYPEGILLIEARALVIGALQKLQRGFIHSRWLPCVTT